jgi:hypothetical protein
VLPAAQNSTRRCEGIHVLPWHSGNVARRNAVHAYASALELELREVASGRRTFDIADDHLARLRQAASISGRPALARTGRSRTSFLGQRHPER